MFIQRISIGCAWPIRWLGLFLLVLSGAEHARAQDFAHDATTPSFASLPDLRTLRALQLGPETTDAMLVHLEGLTNLRDLAMQDSKVTGAGLRHISGLTNLEKLNCSLTHVGDSGLEYVGQLVHLKRLRLAGTSVTGAGLASLKSLDKLEILDLAGDAPILDDDLVNLRHLVALRELNIQSAMITGPGLTQLSSLTRLQRLVLPLRGLDKESVEKLQKALPNAKIEHVEDNDQQWAATAISDRGPGICRGIWDPLWTGDYPRFVEVLSRVVDGPRHYWTTWLWLGHASALQGDRQRAAQAYHRAIREHEKLISDDIRARPNQPHDDSWPLIRYVGEYELYELGDGKAAARTFMLPQESEPDGIIQPSISNMFEERELLSADACEQSGNFLDALDRYLLLLYDAKNQPEFADSESAKKIAAHAARVAALRRKANAAKQSGNSRLAVLSASASEATFKPSDQSIRQIDSDRQEDVFAVLAAPGKRITSFQFTVSPSKSYDGGQCLIGLPPHGEICWLEWSPSGLKPHAFKPVDASADVVYLYFPRKDKRPGIAALTVRVLKWSDEKMPQSAAEPKSTPRIVQPPTVIGPFQVRQVAIPGLESTGLADAALSKLPDGRWLIAVPAPGSTGRRRIMLSTSRDLKQWTPPHVFEHNGMFDSIEPTLFCEENGIGMFYRSNRFELGDLNRYDNGGVTYNLWLSRTRDGIRWSRPVPIPRTQLSYSANWNQYDRGTLVRMPSKAYAWLEPNLIVHSIAPRMVPEEVAMTLWQHKGWPYWGDGDEPTGLNLLYDSKEVCHYFVRWRKGDLYYCRPSNLLVPDGAVKLLHSDKEICTLLPLIDGNRMLLYCGTDSNAVLLGGIIEADRVRMGKPLALSGLTYRNSGRQFCFVDGRVYLPIGGNVRERPGPPPALAPGVDPFGPPGLPIPGSNRTKDDRDDNLGPCLLQADFNELFRATAPANGN